MSYAARNITVRVAGAPLLTEVTLAVEPGEIVALAGPNGAGKSTLVAVLAGDRRPTSGTVTLGARELEGWSRWELARRRAVMGGGQDVAFDFTAEEIVLLGRLPVQVGEPGRPERQLARRLLEAVDCELLADRAFSTLSTGERQRVQLARAIAQVVDWPPDVDAPEETLERYLLLDEPISSLDPAHQHVAMRLLREQARAGRGVLAVLHDLNVAAAYADRLVLLSEGRVAVAGTVADVLRPGVLEPVFGIAMLVLEHPASAHPIVVAEAPADIGSGQMLG
jgi:iron complex transport system ATP-binding protein